MAFASSTGLWEEGNDVTKFDFRFIGALLNEHNTIKEYQGP